MPKTLTRVNARSIQFTKAYKLVDTIAKTLESPKRKSCERILTYAISLAEELETTSNLSEDFLLAEELIKNITHANESARDPARILSGKMEDIFLDIHKRPFYLDQTLFDDLNTRFRDTIDIAGQAGLNLNSRLRTCFKQLFLKMNTLLNRSGDMSDRKSLISEVSSLILTTASALLLELSTTPRSGGLQFGPGGKLTERIYDFIDDLLELYVGFFVLELRVSNKLPALEGILVMKERQ